MSDVRKLLKKSLDRISREGFIGFLYSVSSHIEYPPNGFPRYGVDEFMKTSSREVAKGSILLDAGAGNSPYRGLFDHAEYQSCDFRPIFKEMWVDTKVTHDFYCDLERIPKEEGTYDVIICNQVLEHVRYPDRVVREFYRILKPGGKLFLTAPQCFGIHMAPHNYFNFLSYGLKMLFEEAGFSGISTKPLGGIFWVIGKVVRNGYDILLGRINNSLKPFFFPFHVLIRLFILGLSFCLFHLDKLDSDENWTLNYGCCCHKPTDQ